MKKLLFILFVVMSTAMYAEENLLPTSTPNDLSHLEFVRRSGKHFYQGDQLLTKHEYTSLLKTTSLEAFRQYQRGKHLMTAGWTVFGVGAGIFTVVGLGGFAGQAIAYAIDPPNPDTPTMPGLIFIGVYFGMPIGTGIMLAGVPILSVGYALRNKSVKTYNLQCSRQEPPITCNLTASQNGLGFAINF